MNKIEKIFSLVEGKGYHTKILTNLDNLNKISEDTLLEFECVCGAKFGKKYSQIRDQKYILCQKCAIERRVDKRRKDFRHVKKLFEDNKYKILLNQNYVNNVTKLEVEDEEGYRGFLEYRQLKKGDSLVRFSTKTNEKYFLYNIRLHEKKNNYSSSVLSIIPERKDKSRTVISVKCGCGEIYETTYIYYLNKDGQCAKCINSLSSYESKMRNYLFQNGIYFISEYTFADCRDKNPLPFDFYLPEYNLVIEIDGEGHYFPCHFNNISKDKAVFSFEKIKYHDLLKNIYCMENHIDLLRIPYWEIKDSDGYRKIITSLLCSYSRH